ncbi:hypothetical protein NLI96_g3606 [Meripilus lineatus]|uniref:GDP-fucose protein O-fucosyltransferase 2 n=1 Tax=Meripilus lineatus TaxID=2056292 RepID=A0AAD5VBV0_9APHY|nr:hypothetical protein NLI96_g3606 [Physisporinus lineatus]
MHPPLGTDVEYRPLPSSANGAYSSSHYNSGRLESPWMRKLSRRQWIAVLAASLILFALASHTVLPTRTSHVKEFEQVPFEDSRDPLDLPDTPRPVDDTPVVHVNPGSSKYYEAVLNGPPTAKFRGNPHNLRNDTRYLTSWINAGFTNDVLNIGNIVYLARMTDRIPVLPPLDSYIGHWSTPRPLSSVFDLARLSEALGFPVLEWSQVKDPESTEIDVLGCWNIWQVANLDAIAPREARNPRELYLDMSYTTAPANVKLIPGYVHDSHSSFWSLAPLAFHDMRAKALAQPEVQTSPAPQTGVSVPPDEQMLCYDYLFYTCVDEPFEYDNDVYPTWDVVLKHLHWTKEVERIGNEFLRKLLGVPDYEDTPPHITIHARHGDFQNWCPDADRQGCFTSMEAYSTRIAEIQQELMERKGINVTRVIMTSDEQDESWWDRVREMGWLRIDHEKENTIIEYGEWYPVLIDAYIQSASLGFIGTDRSTFSIVAKRRVKDWHDGAVRMVKWGTPDADNH